MNRLKVTPEKECLGFDALNGVALGTAVETHWCSQW